MIRARLPVGLGIESLRGNIRKGIKRAVSRSAEELAEMIRYNIAWGYAETVFGTGGTWDFLGEEPFATGDYWRRLGEPSPAEHPGQVVSGELLESVSARAVADNKIEVEVADDKAAMLEHGGYSVYSPSGMPVPPRPFFRPAIHQFEQQKVAVQILNEEMEASFDEL